MDERMTEQDDLQRRIEAGPVCELIAGVPLILPYEGFELPWYLKPALDEVREVAGRAELTCVAGMGRRGELIDRIHKQLALLERRIGITAEMAIKATSGLSFGPEDEDERNEVRRAIRLRRAMASYRPPNRTAPTMTTDERRELDKIERRRADAEREMARANTHKDRTAAYARIAQAGDDALALSAKIANRQEAAWIADALHGAEAALNRQGEDVERAQTGARRRYTPLTRLFRGELISQEQLAAGMRYGDTWRRLYGGAKGEGAGNPELDPLESRIADLKRLDKARGYEIDHAYGGGTRLIPQGLHGDARLIKLCDEICGAERSLRESVGTSAHKRKIGMERLGKALGLLALHYGLIKTREDEAQAAW